MRIAMVSDSETGGGAAIAASRLASALIARGHEVVRVVFDADGKDHPWRTIQRGLGLRLRILRRLISSRRWRSLAESATTRDVARMVGSTDPDIVNVHNIHGVFSSLWTPELVKHCSDRFPTIWTLHDMWSFTGRCAYNRDCREFETGCDATCPTADEYPQLDPDEIEDAWNLRSNLARSGPNLRAVAPSRWLADEAVTGLWPEASVDVIPYGVPLDVFKPEDRHAARAALGIESSTPVFLAVAVDWIDQRKGGGVLQDALTNWGGGLTLLTMGTDDHDWGGLGDIRVLKLGFIGDEKTLARAFNAADALIHPALQDNLPNVVLEAIACGTPVVSFRTGGLPDMVRPGSTGWLAEKPDAASLAAAIECAVTELEAGSGLRESCRSTAETEFDPRLQAQRYEALFHQVLASGRT